MARLLAFGGDNGNAKLDALDAVDLEAIQAVRAWGVNNGHEERSWTPTRCTRPDRGGAIIDRWGIACCMLWGR